MLFSLSADFLSGTHPTVSPLGSSSFPPWCVVFLFLLCFLGLAVFFVLSVFWAFLSVCRTPPGLWFGLLGLIWVWVVVTRHWLLGLLCISTVLVGSPPAPPLSCGELFSLVASPLGSGVSSTASARIIFCQRLHPGLHSFPRDLLRREFPQPHARQGTQAAAWGPTSRRVCGLDLPPTLPGRQGTPAQGIGAHIPTGMWSGSALLLSAALPFVSSSSVSWLASPAFHSLPAVPALGSQST